MERLSEQSPQALARALEARGLARAWLRGGLAGRVRASHPDLDELARHVAEGDWRGHDAVFLAVGPETGALMSATLHRTARGQAQGGLRHAAYQSVSAFLSDGLRLAEAMGRKCALAGLWWSGGKGLIARQPHRDPQDRGYREVLYREYGDFVSSLRGCYVTAEDAGTTPEDLAAVFARTRFVTCIPRAFGGSGNPSAATAAGVLCGMEAALDHLGLGSLRDKRVAVQGLGHVGEALLRGLLERGVRGIVGSDVRADRCRDIEERFRDAPLEVRCSPPADETILAEPCDVLAPNALGGVLHPRSIPTLRARLVCGAANNQLLDEDRDGAALAARGITHVPEFVVNRMGIVSCANEQYGRPVPDPAVERHLDPAFEDGIPAVTRRVLEQAAAQGVPPHRAANDMADALLERGHPLWGERTHAIVRGLTEGDWATRAAEPA